MHRLGHVFSADMGPDWMCSYAAYPTPVLLNPELLRVFFVTRDSENRGMVAWIDLNPQNPCEILALSPEPCLHPGPIGTFFDRGISIGSIHTVNDALWMYFLGWNKSADVPFRNSIGLAIDKTGTGTNFIPAYDGPLIDRSRFDAFTLSYPFVSHGNNNTPWHMFYGSSRNGGADEKQMHHVLTEASSIDGIDWKPTGEDTIGVEAGEIGLSRPWVYKNKKGTFLFYSIRREKYSIGVSQKNITTNKWIRINSDILSSTNAEWEDEATCYPALITINSRTFMFYNGNGYGRTGFGLAELFTW